MMLFPKPIILAKQHQRKEEEAKRMHGVDLGHQDNKDRPLLDDYSRNDVL